MTSFFKSITYLPRFSASVVYSNVGAPKIYDPTYRAWSDEVFVKMQLEFGESSKPSVMLYPKECARLIVHSDYFWWFGEKPFGVDFPGIVASDELLREIVDCSLSRLTIEAKSFISASKSVKVGFDSLDNS